MLISIDKICSRVSHINPYFQTCYSLLTATYFCNPSQFCDVISKYKPSQSVFLAAPGRCSIGRWNPEDRDFWTIESEVLGMCCQYSRKFGSIWDVKIMRTMKICDLLSHVQGRRLLRLGGAWWQETSLAHQCSTLTSFGNCKCTLLKKVLATLLGLFGPLRYLICNNSTFHSDIL